MKPKDQRSCPLSCLAGPLHDGELDPVESRRYMEHLFRCPACRDELRVVRRLSQLLRSEGNPGPWEPGVEDVSVAETLAEGDGRAGAARSKPRPRLHPVPAAGFPGGGTLGRQS